MTHYVEIACHSRGQPYGLSSRTRRQETLIEALRELEDFRLRRPLLAELLGAISSQPRTSSDLE